MSFQVVLITNYVFQCLAHQRTCMVFHIVLTQSQCIINSSLDSRKSKPSSFKPTEMVSAPKPNQNDVPGAKNVSKLPQRALFWKWLVSLHKQNVILWNLSTKLPSRWVVNEFIPLLPCFNQRGCGQEESWSLSYRVSPETRRLQLTCCVLSLSGCLKREFSLKMLVSFIASLVLHPPFHWLPILVYKD